MMHQPEHPAAPCPPRAVLDAFGLTDCTDVRPAGGTACPKWAIRAGDERFVIRVRPGEFAGGENTAFDHAALRRLGEAGLPVPQPLAAPDGETWVRIGDRVYEALTWVDGETFDEGDVKSHRGLGRFLGQFHRALAADPPEGKAGRPREDHPDEMAPYLAALRELACDDATHAQLDRIGEQLANVRAELDASLYGKLPHCVIHGDVHGGNLRFRDGSVSAVYDFDYLSVQARARDVSDAILFFASTRPSQLNADDIRSLTQPVTPDPARAAAVLDGYQTVATLTDAEWRAMPLLMRSRWVQVRLRGGRKVPGNEKLSFVLTGFFDVIDWLDHEAPAFVRRLRG